jgi:hypothetical protein
MKQNELHPSKSSVLASSHSSEPTTRPSPQNESAEFEIGK